MTRSSVASMLRREAAVALPFVLLAPSSAFAVSCTVSTLPVTFGVYDPLSAAPLSTTGEIDAACTCSVVDCVAFQYRVEISAGGSGNTASRELRAGSARLLYNLYSDAAYSSVWGTGSAGYSALYLVALFGSKQALTVYARIPAGQNAVAGTYSDAPVVTISY